MSFKTLLLAFLASSFCLFAQNKVAYIQMTELFEQYYKTINANIIFEHKKKDYEDKMAVLSSDIENALRDVRASEAEANNELLDAKVREEAIRKYKVRAELFQTKRMEFEKARQIGLNELQRIREETESTLVTELTQLIEKYAANKGYTHVYDVSGNSLNRVPFLLVYPKKQDVTKAILDSVNKGHEGEITTAKAKLDALRKAADTKTTDSKAKPATK